EAVPAPLLALAGVTRDELNDPETRGPAAILLALLCDGAITTDDIRQVNGEARLHQPGLGRDWGWIYFAGDGEVIKIGFSRQPRARVKALGTLNGRDLELWTCLPGY